MSTITKEDLNVQAAAMMRQVAAHRNSPVMTRINIWCVNKTKMRLADYLGNQTVPAEERMQFMKDLESLLAEQRFDELPEVPKGQATATEVTPAPVKPVAPPPPPPKPPVLVPAAPPPVPPEEAIELEDGEEEDPIAAIMEALKKLKPKPVPPALPSLTEADVRRIVRLELAECLASIARGLEEEPS